MPSALWEIALLRLQNTIQPVETRTGGDDHCQVLRLARPSWDPRGSLFLSRLAPLYCPVRSPAGRNIWIRVKSFLWPWKTKKQTNSVGQPAAWAGECSPKRRCRWWCWRGLWVRWHHFLCPWRQPSHVALLPWASTHVWVLPPADQVPGKMAFIAESWECVQLGIGNALILFFFKGFWDTASLGSTEASFSHHICRKYYHGLCLPVLSDGVAGITNAGGLNFRKGQDFLEPVPVGRNAEFSQEAGEPVTGFFFIRMLTFSWSGRAAETFCRTATRKGAHQGPPSGFLCLQLMFARQSLRMKDGAI